MGLRLKPNCRADFDPAEFSVVCGNDRAAWLLGGNSAREVSPPRDFSQHDGFKGNLVRKGANFFRLPLTRQPPYLIQYAASKEKCAKAQFVSL